MYDDDIKSIYHTFKPADWYFYRLIYANFNFNFYFKINYNKKKKKKGAKKVIQIGYSR